MAIDVFSRELWTYCGHSGRLCPVRHHHLLQDHIADQKKINFIVLQTIGSFFLSHFLLSVSLPSINMVRGASSTCHLYNNTFFKIMCSSRSNPSWSTHRHAETPIHRFVRNRTPIVLVGRTFWNILLVDWSVKYFGARSCFLTRTRYRKRLCYYPGNRLRSGERSGYSVYLLYNIASRLVMIKVRLSVTWDRRIDYIWHFCKRVWTSLVIDNWRVSIDRKRKL